MSCARAPPRAGDLHAWPPGSNVDAADRTDSVLAIAGVFLGLPDRCSWEHKRAGSADGGTLGAAGLWVAVLPSGNICDMQLDDKEEGAAGHF